MINCWKANNVCVFRENEQLKGAKEIRWRKFGIILNCFTQEWQYCVNSLSKKEIILLESKL